VNWGALVDATSPFRLLYALQVRDRELFAACGCTTRRLLTCLVQVSACPHLLPLCAVCSFVAPMPISGGVRRCACSLVLAGSADCGHPHGRHRCRRGPLCGCCGPRTREARGRCWCGWCQCWRTHQRGLPCSRRRTRYVHVQCRGSMPWVLQRGCWAAALRPPRAGASGKSPPANRFRGVQRAPSPSNPVRSHFFDPPAAALPPPPAPPPGPLRTASDTAGGAGGAGGSGPDASAAGSTAAGDGASESKGGDDGGVAAGESSAGGPSVSTAEEGKVAGEAPEPSPSSSGADVVSPGGSCAWECVCRGGGGRGTLLLVAGGTLFATT
jgi:hypothetical protein